LNGQSKKQLEPAKNAPKWFAVVEIIRLATDHDWLHKVTKEIAKFWRQKRERHGNRPLVALKLS
jgi:hypothetical protein